MSTRLFDRFFDEVDASSAMRRFVVGELSRPGDAGTGCSITH